MFGTRRDRVRSLNVLCCQEDWLVLSQYDVHHATFLLVVMSSYKSTIVQCKSASLWWRAVFNKLCSKVTPMSSLRSKRSRTTRTKFGPRDRAVGIRAARKLGREQKGGRRGVGEGTPHITPNYVWLSLFIDTCAIIRWAVITQK